VHIADARQPHEHARAVGIAEAALDIVAAVEVVLDDIVFRQFGEIVFDFFLRDGFSISDFCALHKGRNALLVSRRVHGVEYSSAPRCG
jgi:hypothetical protein